MATSRFIVQFLLAACPLHFCSAEPLRVVFQNGKSIPVSALMLQGDKLVLKTPTEGFGTGQTFSIKTADYIQGAKPPEINQALAHLLNNSPADAQKLLLPIVEVQDVTAKISGNYWLDAARALLVTYAALGDSSNTSDIGKKISAATSSQGVEPFVLLGKALLMSDSAEAQNRELALRDLTTDAMPDDLRAFASFYLGDLFKKQKKTAEALEAYLSITTLFPSGGVILNAAAELQAAEILATMKRREESVALMESALRVSAGTVLAEEANSRIKLLK